VTGANGNEILDEMIVPLDQDESEDDVSLDAQATNDAVIFNTDWTVETLFRQIDKGNVDLDPQFQRREAWKIDRQSRFIESILCNLPIPNVVLAEKKGQRGKYIVIDGKQRLYTIKSFFDGNFELKGLTIRSDLNSKRFSDIELAGDQDVASLENYPIRTVIIRSWPDEDYLYTVFFRLNSGSLPLSPQELRRALHGGHLLNFIDRFLLDSVEFKKVFGANPDPRMRDVEMALRYVGVDTNLDGYDGNLKRFLDNLVISADRAWPRSEGMIRKSLDGMARAIKTTHAIFGEDSFKKWNGVKFERRTNRAVFDVMTRYFSQPDVAAAAEAACSDVKQAFVDLCSNNEAFRNSIERTTKTREATLQRLSLWGEALGPVIGMTLDKSTFRMV
jgi:hypothetical protein